MSEPSLGARARIDEWLHHRRRDREFPSTKAPRGGFPTRPFEDRPPHVIVAPLEGPAWPSWGPGTRNFYFEAAQSLKEILGEEAVSVLDVPSGSEPQAWHEALRRLIGDTGATHVLTHIECDPGSPDSWTWDVMWADLAQSWDGVLLGVFFDSAFHWIQAKGRRLARMSSNFVAVDICMPLDSALVRHRPEIGPVNMPVSKMSLAMLDQALEGSSHSVDVSFIGALYPYRVELIERLRADGVSVAVNPHRADTTSDLASSRTGQPSWLEYMRGLASSRMTLNFSRSSAGPYEQLKTRVIEGALAGTAVLTDDTTRSRIFFAPGREIIEVDDWAKLPHIVGQLLCDGDQLASIGAQARMRARELAPTGFWEAINARLGVRGLPGVEA